MSRDELLLVVGRQSGQLAEQAEQLAARDRQIAGMAGQLADLMEANEALAARLARLEHLLSRNSGNSSSPPSRDDDPGKPPAPGKPNRGSGPARARGKQPGAPGSHLAWTDDPHDRRDRFPTGHCDCGADLADAADLGVIDRYQQHEIPQVAVRITQYDQHEGLLRVRAPSHRHPHTGCPARPGRVRPPYGRVRGLPHGDALRARAPGGRAAGIADRDRAALGRVRTTTTRPTKSCRVGNTNAWQA